MKKIVLISIPILLFLSGVYYIYKPDTKSNSSQESSTITSAPLPINTLPLSDRPFITISPDQTGRSLNFRLSKAPTNGNLEYELIYNAHDKQEGAFGSLFLSSEAQPITKTILLGSKSGGGKITYHEGITGGTLTVTYGEVKLKESWNYISFNPNNPVITSTDGRFSVEINQKSLKKDAIIVVHKTFGYEQLGLPEGVNVISGPYAYFPNTTIKNNSTIEIKLPSGEHKNPTIYVWNEKTWSPLTTKIKGDTVTSSSSGSVFLVTSE